MVTLGDGWWWNEITGWNGKFFELENGISNEQFYFRWSAWCEEEEKIKFHAEWTWMELWVALIRSLSKFFRLNWLLGGVGRCLWCHTNRHFPHESTSDKTKGHFPIDPKYGGTSFDFKIPLGMTIMMWQLPIFSSFYLKIT
jgi:hypothetical protein